MLRNNRLRHMLAGPLGYVLIIVLLVVFLFAVFRLVSGVSSVAVLADIRQRGTIVIGVPQDIPPYGNTENNGTSAGFEADLAIMIGEKILGGPGVQHLPLNVKTARAYLDTGECNMLVCMVVVNDVNREKYNLTEPYVQEDVLLLCRTGEAPSLQSSDTKIGVILGSDAETVLNAYLKNNHFDATVVNIASYPEAVTAIENGSIQAFCAAYSVVSRYAAQSALFINPVPVGHLNYAIAVRKSETDLFNAVKSALESIKQDGRLNELYVHYNLSAPIK